MGYKRRNTRLDHLAAHPPPYLARIKHPLTKETFLNTDDEAELNALDGEGLDQFAPQVHLTWCPL